VRFIAKLYLPFLPFTETLVTKIAKRYQLCVLCNTGNGGKAEKTKNWLKKENTPLINQSEDRMLI
jgi:5'(3')-deoxyribonucleotidase